MKTAQSLSTLQDFKDALDVTSGQKGGRKPRQAYLWLLLGGKQLVSNLFSGLLQARAAVSHLSRSLLHSASPTPAFMAFLSTRLT